MAAPETNIVNDILKDISPSGTRLFRNVRGLFYTKDCVRALIAAAMTLNVMTIRNAIKNLRQVTAGLLAPGASDLIGARPVVITQEMVGTTIAVFSVLEVKTPIGRPSPDQLRFLDFVQKMGGFAGVARSKEDARNILKIPVDTPA